MPLQSLYLSVITALGDYPTLNVKYGLGVFRNTSSQIAALSYQTQVYKGLSHQFELGGWPDLEKGHKPSLFGSYSIGVRLLKEGYYLESLHGLGFITNSDRLLGGPFQFFHDVGAGLRDQHDYSIGFTIKHVSSAGIYEPNIGRNYVTIKLGLPL